jgi:hypothetical protein
MKKKIVYVTHHTIRIKYIKKAWIVPPKNTDRKHGVPNLFFNKTLFFYHIFQNIFRKMFLLEGTRGRFERLELKSKHNRHINIINHI